MGTEVPLPRGSSPSQRQPVHHTPARARPIRHPFITQETGGRPSLAVFSAAGHGRTQTMNVKNERIADAETSQSEGI